MNDFAGNYSFLIEKIDEFIRKYYLNKLVRGSIYLLSFFLLSFALVTTLAYYAELDQLSRALLFFAFLTFNIIFLFRLIILPLLSYFKLGRRIGHEQASAIIGLHFAPIKDKLQNTLQLKKMADENPAQRALIEAGINQKIDELRPFPFSTAIRIRDNRKYLRYALPPLLIVLIMAFAAPSILSEGTEHIVYYNRKIIKKAPFDFIVENEQLRVDEGDDFTLQVKLRGQEIPQNVYLHDGPNRYKLDQKSVIQFSHVFRNMRTDKIVFLSADGYESPVYRLSVRKKPTLLNYSVSLKFPAYLQRKTEILKNSTDFTVPEGTTLTWQLRTANAGGLSVSLGSHNRRIKPLKANSFSFAHRAIESTELLIKPMAKSASSTALVNRLTVVKDRHPLIEVSTRPDSLNKRIVYAIGRLSDDYGLSSLHLKYRILSERNGSPAYISRPLSLGKGDRETTFFYVLDADKLGAEPAQQIEYFFEVRDNDGVNGQKASRSETKFLVLESLHQMAQRVEEASEQLQKKIGEAGQRSADIENDAKNLRRDLLEAKEVSYEQTRQLEKLADKHKELDELVRRLKDSNTKRNFERQELLSDSWTDEQQKELEHLFEKLTDDKTDELLREIEALLRENKRGQAAEQLNSMQENQQAFQRDLKRLLDLYKRLDFEQHLSLTAEKLQKLSQKQRTLASRASEKRVERVKLIQEQQQLINSLRDISTDMETAEEKSTAFARTERFQSPAEELSNIENEQQRGRKSLETGQTQNASGAMRKSAKGMESLAQSLSELLKKNMGSSQMLDLLELRKILAALLRSSFEQEQLMLELEKTRGNEPGLQSVIRKQQRLSGNLNTIGESLYALSRRVPQLQSPVDKELTTIELQAKLAMNRLSERRMREAQAIQKNVMTSVNNLVLFLSEVEEQLQKRLQEGQNTRGDQKTLMQLSIMQEKLNQNMQRMREQLKKQDSSPKQSKGSGSSSEQLLKMAREQQLIRHALQKVNTQLNKDGQGKLGNLDKLSKEMEQTEEDLVNKRIRQETIVRQEQILTKLLEAEKANREREWDVNRESKAAVDKMPSYNSSFGEFKRIKNSQTDLLKTVPATLNIFYQWKVGEYFKQLEAK